MNRGDGMTDAAVRPIAGGVEVIRATRRSRGAMRAARLPVAAVALGAALALGAGDAAGFAITPLHIVYAPAAAAEAIADGAPGVAGLADTLRQGPIFDNPRWPASRQLGKVSGQALAAMSAPDMANALRAALVDPRLGPRAGVGVDEISPVQWGAAQGQALSQALDLLGPDAGRVAIYLGPAMVSRVGRLDPRQPLPADLQAVMGALEKAGSVQLEMFSGSGGARSRANFAIYPTRWLARWAPADPDTLHLLFGPGRGRTQNTIWAWARSTPAGRRILRNGAGAWGLTSAQEGIAWLRAEAVFRRRPDAPPASGDYPVGEGGGLRLVARGGTLRVIFPRYGRAVVQLIARGRTRGQNVATLRGPTSASGAPIRLPRSVRPGRYQVRVVALGQGIREVATLAYRHRVEAPPLRLSYAGSALRVSVGAGQRAVVSITPAAGRVRAIGKVTGPATRMVPLPRGLPVGRYLARVVALGQAGRQVATVRFSVGG